MKKYLFRLTILTATFFIGLSAFVLYYFSAVMDIAKPEPLLVHKNFDCIKLKSFPGLSRNISEVKKGKSGYFPKDVFSGDWDDADTFLNDWYGKHLKAMDEKSLLRVSNQNTEIYRFLWLRSFDHPIFVRVERKQNKVRLFAKELDGDGGREPGRILKTYNHTLTGDEWRKFLSLLEQSDYWNLPSKEDNLGRDGAEWILEGVRDNRYHIVDRWSPEKGEHREVCIYLLGLSGLDIDKLRSDLY